MTAYQALAADLRRRIVSGEFRPGDRLPVEPELCAGYGVSRSTVREALRLLSSQNLIRTVRGTAGGSFVAHPDPDHISAYLETSVDMMRPGIDQLTEIRELLEVPAAGLAALRRTGADLEALRDCIAGARGRAAGEVFAPNRDFHVVLLRAAGNPLLEIVARPVFEVLEGRFVRDRAPRAALDAIDREHRVVLRHVEAGDAEGAREATRRHLENLRTVYYPSVERPAPAGRDPAPAGRGPGPAGRGAEPYDPARAGRDPAARGSVPDTGEEITERAIDR
ncbi:FadR/GntR family transcriptional regulator [Streptosporangium longisporum]|uniref:FadR/GntR family transcriptional regulator n=1 Tax=Streptosporangium longisporum TaxID=46187 RepID=A0ABN3YDH4_9ACTN